MVGQVLEERNVVERGRSLCSLTVVAAPEPLALVAVVMVAWHLLRVCQYEIRKS